MSPGHAVYTRRVRALVLVGAVAVAACYGPSVDPCRVSCASDAECPGGAVCGAGGRCHPADQPAACSAAGDAGIDAPDGGLPTGAFSALAVGDRFACAIGRVDREVYCWGDNGLGQLGDGTLTTRGAAAVIAEPGPWKAVGAGTYHACAIKESGEAYCWGSGDRGQVDGDTDLQIFQQPEEVPVPDGVTFTAIDGGGLHTCAVDSDGQMWCWGLGDEGELGRGGVTGTNAPAIVDGATRYETVSAHDARTCAIATDDTAWCWGTGAIGRAGTTTSPTPVEVEGGHTWRQLQAGLGHTCGVTLAGEARCFGVDIGELGEAGTSAVPAVAIDGDTFTVALAGRLVTCAQDAEALHCVGDNRQGQLGRGDREYLPQPATLALPRPVIAGETGFEFTCVLDDGGVVWCWGHDDRGQCGDGVIDDRWVSTPVMGVTGTIATITGADDHVCALNTDGRLWCWGSNASGEVGAGDRVDHGIPVEVPQPDDMPWTDVSAGESHTCAISAGRLYCWGDDDASQLGNGASTESVVAPVQIAPGTTWQRVSAGGRHTCALDSDSQRWCWGDAFGGVLGGGDAITTTQVVPAEMPTSPGPSAWLSIASGNSHTCGVGGGTSSGELWCWGANTYGALGVEPAGGLSHTPLRVEPTASDWLRVDTDSLDGSTCGLRGSTSGGELYCWGLNIHYQLGLGDAVQRDTPARVGSALWLRVDLGAFSACGIDEELELRCWGGNGSRQAADTDDLAVTAIPVQPTLPGMSFRLLAVGWEHVCAVRDDDAIYCWGDGTYGQHGNGNQARLVPTPVVLAE